MKRIAALVAVLATMSYAYLLLAPGVGFAFCDRDLATTSAPRSLGTLDLTLDRSVAGPSPRWFHFRSILWRAVGVVLLLALFFRWGATGTAAVLGAVVFAIHPVGVEAVAYPPARGELIALVFFLAALVLHQRSRGFDTRFLAALLCLVLALFAGVGAAGFALAAFLADGTIRDEGRWRQTLRRWPVYAVYAGAAVAVVGVRSLLSGGASMGVTVADGATTVARSFAYGLRLAVLPVDASARWAIPPGAVPDPVTILSALVLLVLVVLAVRRLRRGGGPLAFATLWFAATLVPAAAWAVWSGRPVVGPLLSIPLIGPAFVAGRPLARAVARRGPARFAAAAILFSLLALTVARTHDWASNASLVTATLRRFESPVALEWKAHDRAESGREVLHRGEALRDRGDTADSPELISRGLGLLREAAELYTTAAHHREESGVVDREGIAARARRALVYLDLGYHQLALQEADEALENPCRPGRIAFLLVRARALREMGDARAAARAIEAALARETTPALCREGGLIYGDLARWYADMGGTRDARTYEALKRSWELFPSRDENDPVRIAIEEREKAYAEDHARLEKAMAQHPADWRPVLEMAILEGRIGHFDRARQLFERLLGPGGHGGDPRVLYPYALFCFEGTDTLEGYDRAAAIYQKLLRASPDSKLLLTAISRVNGGRVLLEASLAQ